MTLKVINIFLLLYFNLAMIYGQDDNVSKVAEKQDTIKHFQVGLFASYQLMPVGERSYNHASFGVQGVYGPIQLEVGYVKLLDEAGIRLIFPNYYVLDDQALDIGLNLRKKWTPNFGGIAGLGYQWHYMTWSEVENEEEVFIDHAHGFYGTAGLFYRPIPDLELSGSIGFRSVAGIGLLQLQNDLLDGMMTRFYVRYTIWKIRRNKE